ncbi:O-methyltransferase-domain-containing protein, partial [Staphylotrichum tortipilum]
ALVYYIRRCLHDYPDRTCITILSHIVNAMAPDSRLLIAEHLLPASPTPSPSTAHKSMIDLAMLTIAGKERTLEDFKALVALAGLRVTQVAQMEGVGVVECMLL